MVAGQPSLSLFQPGAPCFSTISTRLNQKVLGHLPAEPVTGDRWDMPPYSRMYLPAEFSVGRRVTWECSGSQ